MNKVTERTDMVQVSVRKHVSLNLMLVFLKVRNIRSDVVNARVIAPREQETHVDNDNFIVVLNGIHIFADTHFAYAANRDDTKLRRATAFWLWLHL